MLEYDLHRLLRIVGEKTGSRPKRSELNEILGWSHPTVSGMIDNEPRPELEMLERWLRYFRANGLPDIKLSDLIREVPDEKIEVGAERERELA